jgi:hypothetical protein
LLLKVAFQSSSTRLVHIENGNAKDITYDGSQTYSSSYSGNIVVFYLNYGRVGKSYTYITSSNDSGYRITYTKDSLARELGKPRYVVCEIIPYLSRMAGQSDN